MKRAILSLLLIATMMLSTTTALADDLSGGSMPDQGWALTGNWLSSNIGSGAMVENSGTAIHSVHTGGTGEFHLDIQSKYGFIKSHTAVGVITADGRTVTVEYNPADVSYYANVAGSRTLLGHDWKNPYDDHHAYIDSTDGKTYTFKIGSFSQSIDVGSVPVSVYVLFENNGASTAHNVTDESLGRGSGYNLPVLYKVSWSSPEPVPVASIDSVTPASGDAPLKVVFKGSATNDATSFEWDFGDGARGTGASVEHTYSTPGTYEVSLVATNLGGASGEKTTTITVAQPYPEASITLINPSSVTVGDKVTFQGTGTNDPLSYKWDFGDGSEPVFGTSAEHTYSEPKVYDVTFTVTNARGEKAATGQITVNAKPEEIPPAIPVAHIEATTSEENPLTVNFAGSGTNNATSFQWTFGDGETGSGETISHTYAAAGTYSVTLIASSEEYDSEPVSAQVTVNEPAVIPDPSPSPSPSPAPIADRTIDQAQAKAFCEYQFYSPDSIITYDGKGGYTVTDPRKANSTTIANPSTALTLFAVSGKVVSAGDSQPIAGASVVLDNAMQKTDGNGEFTFGGLKAGKYDLAVSADGFVAKTATVDVSEDKQVSLQLEKVSTGIATSASAANETANMTTATTNNTAAAGITSAANATATPATARSPGFEFMAVLIAILVVAGVLFVVWKRK